jgi:broad specificity phosphatase PhoE
MPVPRLLRLQDGPSSLVLVRHAQSVGNVADDEARRQGAARLDLDARDADVELSETGRGQAAALGAWLGSADEGERPTLVVSSPYRRALDTARIALEGQDVQIVVDERLRERDLGLFDGLTGAGIRAEYAQEARRRSRVGKFYYQPPSGESWADVVLRVRSLLADLREGFADERVWLFTHQAVIMSLRYVLDGLDEERLLAVEKDDPLGNASVTTYMRQGDGLVLESFGDTTAVDTYGADRTHEPSQAEVRHG